jgi:hypothetical protein
VKAAALEIVGAGAARAGESDVAVSGVCSFFQMVAMGSQSYACGFECHSLCRR